MKKYLDAPTINYCKECKHKGGDYCYHPSFVYTKIFTDVEKSFVIIKGFPEWCPLEDVNE